MPWQAHLEGRHSYVIGSDGVIVLKASGPMDRSDSEHEEIVLKAAAAEELLSALEDLVCFIEAALSTSNSVTGRQILLENAKQAIAKVEG